LRGHCLWRGGGQEHALAPGELLLINPDDPVDLTYSADCEKFIVKLPCALLEAICAEQRWSHPARGVRFLEHRYRLDQLEGFVGLLALVCREAESGERLARVDSHFEQILGSKLLTLLKTNVSREDPGDAQVVFARLDAYIRRHLQSEIEVAALAEQAHMSTRSLYALFERQLGESPRQYIRRLRLERIRACLEDPGCRVRNLTELALDFGFAHLGRFAEQYRRQFGELPSETLRRRA
ncbi:AraC family transcriptional regulator, partial [Pseudomonas aeruginosa]|nr:AraC family transcriptional regulator [Pseudomonas aeruginosa]